MESVSPAVPDIFAETCGPIEHRLCFVVDVLASAQHRKVAGGEEEGINLFTNFQAVV